MTVLVNKGFDALSVKLETELRDSLARRAQRVGKVDFADVRSVQQKLQELKARQEILADDN